MIQALTKRPGAGTSDPHERLTREGLAQLEAGDIPWLAERPAATFDLPSDPITGRLYAGVATLQLWHATSARGYPTHFWSTRQQLEHAGARLRAGERGATILVSPAAPSRAGQRHRGAGIRWRYLDLLVPVSVYNVAQCSFLPDHLAAARHTSPADVEEAFHELIAATGIDSRLGALRTFYQLSADMIALADWRDLDLSDFRRECLHELIHATGHPARLSRDLPTMFGPIAHGFEDLVAEMGTSFVCAALGIPPALRHADGRDSWIALLREDHLAFARAAAAAAEAAAYVIALRDAQAEAFDRLEAAEAAAECGEAAQAAAVRWRRRADERERWASGRVTGLRPRESLPAARPGDPPWQNLSSSSS